MIFTNSIKCSFLALLTFCSIPYAYGNTSAPAAPQEQQEELQLVLRKRLEQFQTIDRVLQDLLLLIDGSSTRVGNKRELRASALEFRDLIQNITSEAFVQIDPQSLQLLNIICKELAKHLIKALDNNFTSIPPFDLETILTRTPPREPSLEELHRDLAQSDLLLKTLNNKASTAGLRWYNKIYRQFDKAVIQPCEKYNIVGRGSKIALTGLAAFLIWWHSNSENKWLRETFGYAPRMPNGELDHTWHNGGQPISNGKGELEGLTQPKPLGTLGNALRVWRETVGGAMPEVAFLSSALFASYALEATGAKNWVARQLSRFHNFMKGGVFYQQYEKPDDKYLVNPRITFRDIIGMDDAKETLSFIIKYMENPETLDRGKLTPEKGYLLTGPTRSGKTYIIEGLAGEIKEMFKRKGKRPEDFNFFSLNASFVITEGIRNIIDRAKLLAPCILFVDEIDLLGLQRAGGNPTMLSEFLTAMSGCLETDPDKVVIIIGATNKPENLDFALRQRGRFGKEIRFEYPKADERKAFFVHRLGRLANINNFDIDKLVRETENRSFEDLNAIVKSAFQRGILRGSALNQPLLENALDEEVRNIVMNSKSVDLSEREQKLIAVHQAGQALATVLLGNQKLAKVTIKPYLAKIKEESVVDHFYVPEENQQKKIKYGKIYTFHGHDTKNINGLQQKAALCKEMLAGYAAEKIVLGSCGYGYQPELGQQALDVAKSIVAEGVDLNQLPNELKNKYYEKALALKITYEQEIAQLLAKHKDALLAITDALLKQQTLTGDEVARIAGLIKEPATPVATPVTA
jgi:ATP-dependent Zn protease